jgi:splicing factor 3A subunit 1
MGKEDIILERIKGVIIPPPETRKIIDKAAELVCKYGSGVEQTLKKDEKNLTKFSFFNETDPYRSYFDQKVNELVKKSISEAPSQQQKEQESKLLGKKTEGADISNINPLNPSQRNSLQNELRKMIEAKRLEKVAMDNIGPPPQDQFSISHPNIPAVEMDIIKATAQFVARNGQRFLTGLSERETKNPQFDFLKPQHTLFGYFTYLVESYAKCLRREDLTKLNLYAKDRDAVLKKAQERYLWDKKSKENKNKRESLDEHERNQMAQIDWYDFQIVEVIDFTEEELNNTVPVLDAINFNINAGFNSIEGNVNVMMEMNNYYPQQDQIFNAQDEVNNFSDVSVQQNIPEEIISQYKIDQVEVQVQESGLTKNEFNYRKSETQMQTVESLPEPGMKIVKNYVRRTDTSSQAKKDHVKCPLCREQVSIDDWPQHIKVELLDPKWKEIQRELQERKTELNLAPTNDFLGYLGDFSKYRPDLFGDAKDIAKIEEKKKIEAKVATTSTIWDGYAPNMTRTTANIAMIAQQTKKNYEQTKKSDEPHETENTSNNRGLSNNLNKNTNSIPLSVTQQSAQVNKSNKEKDQK